MLKLLLAVIFMIPLCLLNMYKYIQFIYMIFMVMVIMFNMNIYFSNLTFFLYYDQISYLLIILSLWLIMLMYMVSYKIYLMNFNCKIFSLVLLFMFLFLIFTFCSNSFFMFYLFFECSLIPVFLLVMGWGYQPERLKAGIYLLFYTLFASLPLMIGMFYLFYDLKSFDFFMMSYYNMEFLFIYLVMIFSFLVKMPMFFFHLWLPKAHVESPVSGSMILAGVMLKLGGYGMIRVLVLVQAYCLFYSYIWVMISLLGALFTSFYCFMQTDMKMLVAYSSVVHMSFVIVGLMSLTCWGFMGAVIMMLAHGLCSSGLFALVNISYERFHSRSMIVNKGLISFMPTFSMMWFLLLSSNMSAPVSLNLIGEISLIFSMIFWSINLVLVLMLVMFFSAFYSLYLYLYSQHGKFNYSLYSFSSGQVREFLMLLLHWIPLNLMFLHLDLILL
uniref:NADH dehydrogenase subunit 4 n=1 Tax=Hydroptila angulata TaxID=1875522 RepID=UPI0022DCDEFE|nr:NADH dehydrogenase subunit 4 [Hydroptila angulata]UZZ44047.1 NADH dehydrogenase subunit 4 [Hydroptila angulata]